MQHLASGSYGTVSIDDNGWAVKVFEPDCHEAALREITIAQVAQSPHVIPVKTACYTHTSQSMSMECAIGSVHDMMSSDIIGGIAQYGEDFCNQIISSLLSGLSYIHKVGIMHRDVKPENMMVMKDGSIRLSDFSLSKFEAEAECHTPRCGTPSFMAPEMDGCQYTHACDLYSAGVTIMEIVTGCQSIDQKCFESVLHIINSFMPRWADLIRSLIAIDPSRRLNIASYCPNVTSHVASMPKEQLHNSHERIVEVLDILDINDRYCDHISCVVNAYCKMAKTRVHLEFIIIAACIVMGHTTEALDSAFAIMRPYVIGVINDIRARSPVGIYCCKQASGQAPQAVKQLSHKKPFTCPYHEYSDSESDESDSDSDSDMDIEAPRTWSRQEWLQRVTGITSYGSANQKLLQMRQRVNELINNVIDTD